jgi:NADH dehydrogenase
VRIAARHPKREALPPNRVELARADLLEAETVAAALEGADGAVNAVSLYTEKGDLTFESIHVEGAETLARLAREANVPRLVHMSGIGADTRARDEYVRARGQGEIAVRYANSDAVIVRPSAMFGEGDALLTAVLGTVRRLPLFPLFGDGSTRLQPVHVEDVAQAICRLLHAKTPAPVYEFGGATVYSYREFVRAVTAAAGCSVRTVPVPIVAWQSLASIARHLPCAPLTPGQVALATTDNTAAPGLPGLRDLGIEPQEIEAFVQCHHTRDGS